MLTAARVADWDAWGGFGRRRGMAVQLAALGSQLAAAGWDRTKVLLPLFSPDTKF